MANIPTDQQDFRHLPAWSSDTYLIPVAGHTRPYLAVGVGMHMCGNIDDGVSLNHFSVECPTDHKQHTGSYVISFASLEAWYLAAKATREAQTALERGTQP